eukprot:4613184-Amphidinium_carterae.2
MLTAQENGKGCSLSLSSNLILLHACLQPCRRQVLSMPWWWVGGLTVEDEVDCTQEDVLASAQLVDVRTPSEFRGGHLNGAVLCPLLPWIASFPDRLRALDLSPERPTIVICAHAVRSPAGVKKLRSMGFSDVKHLRGGMSRLQRKAPHLLCRNQ